MSTIQFISSFLQRLPAFKGKRRVCRLILKITGIFWKKNISIQTQSGRFILPNLVEMVSFDLFVNGKYEEGLVRLIVERLPKNGIFIDVGANIGSISIPLAKKRPDVKIVSIEASPWIFKILNENIAQNELQNISTRNHAVYFESGKEMFIYAPRDLFGKGSLNPTFTKDGECVTSITIDDLRLEMKLPKVDFVKVDVEGFEICVFQGMNSTIAEFKPLIVFEYADWTETKAGYVAGSAQSYLLSKGYRLDLLNEKFEPQIVDRQITRIENSGNLLAS